MIRFERRGHTGIGIRFGAPIGGLIVAGLLVAILLAIAGNNPLTTYGNMVQAAFTKPQAFSGTLVNATPLVLTGLCAAMAFRMELYNIGGEGQLYMGAMAATATALVLRGQPGYLIIAAMVVTGAIAGGLWSLIPGLFRAYFHANEILTSLMLNYVAGLFITYLIFDSSSYWRELSTPGSKRFPTGKTIPASSFWPNLHLGGVTVPLGFILGIAAAIACAILLRRTTLGFRIRVTAGSPEAARYGGINTRRLLIAIMVLSGALAGIAGASQVGTTAHLLDPTGLQQAQYGYTGIVVAALGSFDPLATILAAVLLGAIVSAGTQLEGAHFPVGLVGSIEGIILFCVVSAALFTRYRMRWRPGTKATAPEAERDLEQLEPVVPLGASAALAQASIHEPSIHQPAPNPET